MIIDQLPAATPNLTDETVTENGTNLFKTTWSAIKTLMGAGVSSVNGETGDVSAAPAGYGLGEQIPGSSIVTDLNAAPRRNGWFLFNSDSLNSPVGGSSGVVLVCSLSNMSASLYQIAFLYGSSPVAYIRIYSAAISAWTAWSGWFGSITESFTYSSALSGFSSSSLGGRYDPSTRTVRIRFNFAASANILTSDVLFTIPEAYRPSGTVYGSAFYQTSSSAAAFQFTLNSNGEIKQPLGNTIRSGFGYIEYVI